MKSLLALLSFFSLFVPSALALSPDSTSVDSRVRNFLYANAELWCSEASNASLRPLLSYSNQWGRFTQYDKGEFGASAAIAFRHLFRNRNIVFRSGLSAQVDRDDKRTMVDQLYADFNLWMFNVNIGRERFTPVLTNTSLSTGSYIMSNNARPVSRAGIGILDFWSLPLNRLCSAIPDNLIQIRGGFSIGLLSDEDNPAYTDDAILQEKFAYARIAAWPTKLYAGLNHSAIMGGVTPDGYDIPVDFWNTFFGRQGSTDVFDNGRSRGETTNAAGAHQGMWDFGLNFDFSGYWSATLYYQRPFTDSRARNPFSHGVKDCTFGWLMNFSGSSFFKELAVEYVNTRWQGGAGFPDPCVPSQAGYNVYLYPGDYDTEDIPHLLNDVLLPDDVAAYELASGEKVDNYPALIRFLRQTYNHNLDFGGRSLYLDNGFYPQGWTVGGLSMGNSLMHTNETVSRYAPEGSINLVTRFPNTRLRAVNVGLRGNLNEWIAYYARVTFSHNYGNYREQYSGPDPSSTWTSTQGYFFSKSRHETYSCLALDFNVLPRFFVSTNLAYDFGDLYHSFASRLSVKYIIK